MFYATAISDTVGLIQNPVLPRNEAIVVFMLTIATLISITCKIDTSEVLNASTFKSGKERLRVRWAWRGSVIPL